ncbi:hypothetical protein [uncultured Robinsoniella sp.]
MAGMNFKTHSKACLI